MGLNLTKNYSINFSLPERSKKSIKHIIIHYTGMKKESEAIKKLCNFKSKVSSHYFIKDNGEILILVWAFEQESDSRRTFTKQDNMVSWILQKKYTKDKIKDETYHRFYHVFKKGELDKLCDLPNVSVEKSFYEKGNWCIILKTKYVITKRNM